MSSSPTTAPRRSPLAAPALALAGLVSVVVAVLALLLAGGAPEPPPAGLPDAGPVVGWTVPVLRLLQHAAAVTTVGVLLLGVLGGRRAVSGRAVLAVWLAALTWAAAALAAVVVGLADVAGRPLGTVLDVDLVRSYVAQVATGRALLWTAALALAVALAAPAVRLPAGRVVLLAVALGALVPPLRTGHASTSDDHVLAVTATSVHVLAAVLWVGGLVALVAARRSGSLGVLLPRFSALALVCFAAVAGSGVVATWTRREQPSQLWSTGYGGLLMAKAALLLLLGAAGWAHRRRTLPAAAGGDGVAFARLAGAEVALMGAAFGVAVALSRTAV